MPTTKGRFYFNRTINGNLIGEFSNANSKINSTESADLYEYIDDFIGKYYTTWQEDGKAIFAELEIGYLHPPTSPNTKIFKLIWYRNRKIIFKGQGILLNKDVLVGDYENS